MEITAIDPYYVAGTATLSTSSTTMTGQSTLWQNTIVPGDQVFGADGRMGGIVASVNSNTSITLTANWRGGNQTAGVYTIYRVSDSVRVESFQRRLLDLLTGGTLTSLAGIDGTGGNLLPYFTGAGAMDATALTAFARSLLDDANAAAVYGTLGQIPNAQVRNDLTADKAFRRGNVVGTVSQSGGTPTGALVETGSNANGAYLRFAGGALICAHMVAHADMTIDIAFQGGVRSGGGPSWTYPSSHVGGPVVVGAPARSQAFGILLGLPGSVSVAYQFTAVSAQTAAERTITLMSFGRWH